MKRLIKLFFQYLGFKLTKHKAFKLEVDFDFTYLDIGASNGLPEKWQKYSTNKFFHLILVEPAVEEAEKIKKLYPNARIIAEALGSKRQKSTLNVTYFQQCSSILEPNFEVLNKFPVKKWFEVTKRIDINIYSFEELAESMQLKAPDFIKIDVQGYESEVIEGFGKYLDGVLAIELETHLLPLYKNQKTLEGMNALLNEKGFMLRHLISGGPFEGEVIEFDAYFIKKPDRLKTELDRKKIEFWEYVNNIPAPNLFRHRDNF